MHNAGSNAETDAETGVQLYAELWMQSDMDVEFNRCRAWYRATGRALIEDYIWCRLMQMKSLNQLNDQLNDQIKLEPLLSWLTAILLPLLLPELATIKSSQIRVLDLIWLLFWSARFDLIDLLRNQRPDLFDLICFWFGSAIPKSWRGGGPKLCPIWPPLLPLCPISSPVLI